MSTEQKNTTVSAFSDEIDVIYMNEMINEYRARIQPVLTKLKNDHDPSIDPTIMDARSAWLSFDELQTFIDDNKATVNADGVRIYYGIHTRDCKPNGTGQNQKGLHNIIFVPTIGSDKPPTYENSQNTVHVENPFVEENSSRILIAGIGNIKIGQVNTLNYPTDTFPLCPPNCPK